MGFESLAALAGLMGVVLPVLLHLRSRAAERFALFPNIELMRDLQRASRYERIVAGAPLLVIRASVIAFAALAASSPFLGVLPPSATALSSGDVVVVLDRSSTWRDREDFERAKRTALRVLESTRDRGRGWLLAFDSFPSSPVSADVAADVLARLSPGGSAGDWNAAIETAARHLGCDMHARAPLQNELEPATMVALSTRSQLQSIDSRVVPDGIRMLALACDSPGESSSPRILEARFAEGRLTVRCAGCSGSRGPVLHLYLDDEPEPHAVRRLSNRAGSDEFEDTVDVPMPPRTARLAGLEIGVSGRTGTHHRYWIALSPGETPRLQVIVPGGEVRQGGVVAMSVEAIAAASGESDALVDVATRFIAPKLFSRESLADADALVVVDPSPFGVDEWAIAEEFVRRGGVILAIASEALPAAAIELFGLESRGEALSGRAALLATRPPRLSPEPVVLTSRLAVSAANAIALSTYDDGRPALLSHAMGKGRALLLTSDLHELLDRPHVVLPLVDSLLRTALSMRAIGRSTSVEDAPLVFDVMNTHRTGSVLALSPGGDRRVLPVVVNGDDGERTWSSAVSCDEPGLWRLLLETEGDRAPAEQVALIGVNAVETDLPRAVLTDHLPGRLVFHASPDELLGAMEGKGTLSIGPLAALATLLLLVCEPLIRRMAKRRALL